LLDPPTPPVPYPLSLHDALPILSMYTVTPDIAHSLGLSSAVGALVSQVVEGSPAEKAGIHTGDVITAVNGQPVKSNSELRNSIRSEEHTSELQSLAYLVCRLLLE